MENMFPSMFVYFNQFMCMLANIFERASTCKVLNILRHTPTRIDLSASFRADPIISSD